MEEDGNGRFKVFLLSMKLGETQLPLFSNLRNVL